MNTEDIALVLLEAHAVVVRPSEPFTFASGIKSPVYTDNRLLMSLPKERTLIFKALAAAARKMNPDVIAGVATAGIPWAAWVANELGKPMVFVRPAAKDHGKGNQIEGSIRDAQAVCVIEDLISTGGSTLGAVKALREIGANVKGAVAIFSYGFPASKEAFEKEQVELTTLTDFPTLINVAKGKGMLSEEERSIAQKWSSDPTGWKP